jgi:hypothetical protein
MFAKKLFFMVATVALFAVTWHAAPFFLTHKTVSAQTETKPAAVEKKSDVAPEVREKALKMLATLSAEVQQFAAPENRIKAQVLAADLLWQDDEKTARQLFQNALNDLLNELSRLGNIPEDDANTSYSERYTAGQLRMTYLLTFGKRDPQAALAALQSLRQVPAAKTEYDPLKDDELELQLASAIAKADPQKGLEVAVKALDSSGINYNTMTTLKDLYKNNPEYGAKFAREMLSKIKTAKVRPAATNTNTSTTLTNVAVGTANISTTESYVEMSLVAQFIRTAEELNKMAVRGKEKKPLALTESEMRELADFIAQTASRQQVEIYSIGTAMSVITKYSPTAAQMIRRKLTAEQARILETYSDASAYEDNTEKTVTELVAEAEALKDEASRNSRYSEAVRKALEKNDLEEAVKISEKIKDKETYGYLFDEIKNQTPLIKARRGDTAEVRRMLVNLKSNDEKVTALTELVIAVAANGDKEAAGKLLDEANQFLPPQVKRKPSLDVTVKIANAFAVVQPERAFGLLETSIAQMNELIAAGILIDEFYEYQTMKNDEVLFATMERQGLLHTPNAVALIKNLATADFERTVNLTNRFTRPEIRIFARLKMAEALLDPDAAEIEKQLRQQYENEHDH